MSVIQQVKLQADNGMHLITWLPFMFNKKRIQVGMRISLKDDETIWTVREVYSGLSSYQEVDKQWKVGGL
jgi:hypothetical protein